MIGIYVVLHPKMPGWTDIERIEFIGAMVRWRVTKPGELDHITLVPKE